MESPVLFVFCSLLMLWGAWRLVSSVAGASRRRAPRTVLAADLLTGALFLLLARVLGPWNEGMPWWVWTAPVLLLAWAGFALGARWSALPRTAHEVVLDQRPHVAARQLRRNARTGVGSLVVTALLTAALWCVLVAQLWIL